MIILKGENCIQFVVTDISKRKSVENRLQYLNQRDPLTGLFNRHHFTQELTKALGKAKLEESQSALLYLDLNELKEINDALGHAAGDRLLLKIARLFHEKLGESAVLARFSGDEFIAMLHGMDEKKIKGAVTSLLSALKETTYSEGGKVFRCDGTIGVVVIDKKTVDAQTALNLVYQACQSNRPKKAAKDDVTAPTAQSLTANMEPMNEPTARGIESPRHTQVISSSNLDWESRLKTALEKDGFQLAYQPIVNLHGDAAEFFEVLIRLVGRHGELIHAGEFMEEADRLGLLESIDQWVIRQAIQSLSALHSEGRLASFFINVSPSALKNLDLLAMLQKQLSATRVKPEHLILEADESAIMANPREAAVFMQAVRSAGCRFSVDNFGNNLATLNRLRDMPIDFLKITGSLIRNLADDILTRTSLKAIIDLAKTMNRQTIAKFVEQADDLGVLWNLGFDYVQGNYFQHADTHTDFEFAGETTLSSEVTSPTWTTNYNR
jgi:diguanylate cyclase (GGDEF)-like protein